MKKIIAITFFTLSTLCCIGQKYRPSIVILSPYETVYDSVLLEEIESFYFEGYYTPEDEKKSQEQLEGKPENIVIMKFSERRFRELKDFPSKLTMSFHGMISYIVLSATDKALIFPVRDRSNGHTAELRVIAKRHGVRWVINPVTLHSYVRDGQKMTTVRLQVFDAERGRMVLNREYTGDSTNPGSEMSCQDGSLNCTINNIVTQSLEEMLPLIFKAK